ncbi:hypothetical protein PMIN01_05918 [Paraphaeosphaeria minitans]|uniref:Uncharacterized protein n=1 Tax=Paraphaeosphaeria minitans TaxID=565426 RepID=A0A9P6GJ27_9PLEO|nr:hypothetical protein PMIN01_05918 [Paraphaeosphaeria minitans]
MAEGKMVGTGVAEAGAAVLERFAVGSFRLAVRRLAWTGQSQSEPATSGRWAVGGGRRCSDYGDLLAVAGSETNDCGAGVRVGVGLWSLSRNWADLAIAPVTNGMRVSAAVKCTSSVEERQFSNAHGKPILQRAGLSILQRAGQVAVGHAHGMVDESAWRSSHRRRTGLADDAGPRLAAAFTHAPIVLDCDREHPHRGWGDTKPTTHDGEHKAFIVASPLLLLLLLLLPCVRPSWPSRRPSLPARRCRVELEAPMLWQSPVGLEKDPQSPPRTPYRVTRDRK